MIQRVEDDDLVDTIDKLGAECLPHAIQDRLVLLFLGGLIQWLVAPSGGVTVGLGAAVFGPLEWFMVLFAILGNVTAVQRALKIWRGFSA